MIPINATNQGLILQEGLQLAVIDVEGNVQVQGDLVSTAIFQAMTAQVIEQFCSRFTAFTKDDFKNHDTKTS